MNGGTTQSDCDLLPLAGLDLNGESERPAPRGGGIRLPGFFAGAEHGLLRVALLDLFDSRASAVNPLMLVGRRGSGKSHIAHGVAELARRTSPSARVTAIEGGQLSSVHFDSLEERRAGTWGERFSCLDWLVIDDLSAAIPRVSTQWALVGVIDALVLRAKRVVCTSLLPPNQLPGILPELAGRLMAGLQVVLPVPSSPVRQAVVRELALVMRLPITADAVTLLGDRLSATVPKLFAALVSLDERRARQETIVAEHVTAYLRNRPQAPSLSMRAIALCCARHFGLRLDDLTGSTRRRPIVRARSTAMFLTRQLTSKTHSQIGEFFGGRDHSTVMHDCRQVELWLKNDGRLKGSVNRLRQTLANETPGVGRA